MGAAGDVWVFREGKRREAGGDVVARALAAAARVKVASSSSRRVAAVDAAVACGELEAALADAGAAGRRAAERASDALASLAIDAATDDREAVDRAACAERELASIRPPATLTVAAPEGFAYYALHPEAFARASLDVWKAKGARREPVLVVGARSIGTTLSAFARAALARCGLRVERMTVRPTGAPFDRRLVPSADERAAFARAAEERALVLVVDEGPGASGSTLLAIVDALAAAGVPRGRVVVVCSGDPDAERLVAPDAASRWRAIDAVRAPVDIRVPDAESDVSGGAWRALFWRRERDWPETIAFAERRKLLRGDRLFKYEGLGSGAAHARARAAVLADAGLSPALRDEGDGWASYPLVDAALPCARGERDPAVLARVAAYCARRAALFPADVDSEPLVAMVEKNFAVVVGRGVRVPELVVERPVVADGRMQPCEWLRGRDGLVKVDAIAHGDDHFFPGPTDVAWDLAGVVVEWALEGASKAAFLGAYARASGDDAAARVAPWIAAYAVFRAAMTALGIERARGSAEEARLARAHAYYRDAAARASASWRTAA